MRSPLDGLETTASYMVLGIPLRQDPSKARPPLERVLIWLEITLGAVIAVGGAALATLGLLTGHHDKHHGGAYVIFAGLLLMGIGVGVLIPGMALRARHPAKWLLQLVPLAGLVYWLAT